MKDMTTRTYTKSLVGFID